MLPTHIKNTMIMGDVVLGSMNKTLDLLDRSIKTFDPWCDFSHIPTGEDRDAVDFFIVTWTPNVKMGTGLTFPIHHWTVNALVAGVDVDRIYALECMGIANAYRRHILQCREEYLYALLHGRS